MNTNKSRFNLPQAPAQAAAATAAVEKLLRCPVCRGRLFRLNGDFCCVSRDCEKRFPVVDGVPELFHDDHTVFSRADFATQRDTVLCPPRPKYLMQLDRWLPSLSRNFRAKRNFEHFAEILLKRSRQPLVLVVGGVTLGEGMAGLVADSRIRLVETDVKSGPRTQVICDAHDLPFADGSFDGVVVQAVLQYVADPARCAREIERVLKPRGVVYVEAAFMQQVVNGRYDFSRFTHLGLRRLFRRFEEIESGVSGGPGMALAWACQFFLLSFAKARWARRVIYAATRLALFWLKYFDAVLLKRPGAYDAASGFFFMGRKSDKILSDRALVALYRGVQCALPWCTTMNGCWE